MPDEADGMRAEAARLRALARGITDQAVLRAIEELARELEARARLLDDDSDGQS